MTTPIIEKIREKVNDVKGAVLVDCVRIGTDMSQGDGFTHYMVTARGQMGNYITWRAIDRNEDGESFIVLDGGRYYFDTLESALCDMVDRARWALANGRWVNVLAE